MHKKKYHKDFFSAELMLDTCFYADDLMSVKDDVPFALNISLSAEKIMKDAGTSFKNWI